MGKNDVTVNYQGPLTYSRLSADLLRRDGEGESLVLKS